MCHGGEPAFGDLYDTSCVIDCTPTLGWYSSPAIADWAAHVGMMVRWRFEDAL